MNTCRPLMSRILVLVLLMFSLSASVGADALKPPASPVSPQAAEKRLASAPDVPLAASNAPAFPSAPNSLTITAVSDAGILEGYPTSGCGSKYGMRVGYDDYLDPDGEIVRGLVKFNLASIPAGATINSAQLSLYLSGSWDYDGYSRTITTYRVAAAWAEDIVNWSTAPGYAEAYGSASVLEGVWTRHLFDVTNLVRGWQNGTWPNYGIMLRGPEHSGSDSSWREFATSKTIYPPQLIVNYTLASESPEAAQTRGLFVSSMGALRAADFVLATAPITATVRRGNNISYTVSVSPTEGFSEAVALDVSGLPDLATAGWTTNPLAPGGSQKVSTTLTISTTAATTPGKYTLSITGSSGSLVHAVPVTLTVQQQIYLPVVLKAGEQFSSLFLIIGIADYQRMEPHTVSARAGAPGWDLIQPIHDSNDVDDGFSMRGCSLVAPGATFGLQAASAGCPSQSILVLNDRQATKAAIQNAIVSWLATRASSNTTVVIFFSGHGSRKWDDGGKVYHEYIAPYDLQCDPCGSTPETTVWRLETAIRDDELAAWLNQVPSQRMVLLFDSCFSGGMVSSTSLPRGLATGGNTVRPAQAGGGMLARVSAPGRLALMASAADQPSWEFGALRNGVFTYYLMEGLLSTVADANHNGKVSAEEAFAYLQGRVDSYVYSHTGSVSGGPYHQNPQISDGISGEVDLTLPTSVTTCP